MLHPTVVSEKKILIRDAHNFENTNTSCSSLLLYMLFPQFSLIYFSSLSSSNKIKKINNQNFHHSILKHVQHEKYHKRFDSFNISYFNQMKMAKSLTNIIFGLLNRLIVKLFNLRRSLFMYVKTIQLIL